MNLYQYVNFAFFGDVKQGFRELGGRLKNVGQGLKDSWNISHTDRSKDIEQHKNKEWLSGRESLESTKSFINNTKKSSPEWYQQHGKPAFWNPDYYKREADAAWNSSVMADKNWMTASNNVRTLQDFNKKSFLPNIGKSFGNLFRSASNPNELNANPELQPYQGYFGNTLINVNGTPYQPPKQ